MKNLSKALALLVVFAMTLSSVAFASFPDVAEDAEYAEAVNVGVALGLFTGYEDGTFQPEGSITRAEFAAIVVRLRGQDSVGKGATSFKDVPADHWASGYINVATQLKIVNGYGDGNFGPEDPVLYEQAIKMIVVALGYNDTLIGAAGYPVGYLTTAGAIGLTTGLRGENGVAANRGLVAQIVFNSLDLPLMKQTGYGTLISYDLQDGIKNPKASFLSDYLGVVRINGQVTSSTLLEKATDKAVTVKVTVLNNYKSKYGESGSNTDFVKNTEVVLEAGKSGIENLVGNKANIYVEFDGNSPYTPVVLYASKDTSRTSEEVISTSQLEEVVVHKDENNNDINGYVTVKYRETPSDRYLQSFTVDAMDSNGAATSVYINGVLTAYTSAAGLRTILTGSSLYGEIAFSSINAVNDYNTIFITTYKSLVVQDVNTRISRVNTYAGNSLVYANSQNTIKATLYGVDGNVMKWEDLQEYDVVTYTTTGNTTATTIVNAWVVDNKVTGKVTSIDTIDESNPVVYIDGEEYDVDTNTMSVDDLTYGDEGIFYFDKLGNMIYFEAGVDGNTVMSNYAYIVGGIVDTKFSSTLQLKLFTLDGVMKQMNVASTLKLDGVTFKSSLMFDDTNSKALVKEIDVTDISKTTYVKNHGEAPYKFNGNNISAVKGLATDIYDDTAAFDGENVIPQLIVYTTNTAGQITMIDRAMDVDGSIANVKNKFTLFAEDSGSSEYNDRAESISIGGSNVFVTDKTVIMVIPGSTADLKDDDKYELYSKSALGEDTKMNNAAVYNVNEAKEAGCILIKDSGFTVSTSNSFAVARSTQLITNDDYEQVNLILSYKDGLSEEIETTSDAGEAPAVGSVFLPLLNANNIAKKTDILTNVDTANNLITATAKAEAANADPDSKVRYYYGKVNAVSKNRTITLAEALTINGKERADFTVKSGSSVNVYMYDERIDSVRNRVTDNADVTMVNVETIDNVVKYDDGLGNISSYYVFAREYEGSITDVMLYVFK